MGFRAGFYLLVLAVGLLGMMGLGLLDQGSKKRNAGQPAVAAAPLASNNSGNSSGNGGGGNSSSGNNSSNSSSNGSGSNGGSNSGSNGGSNTSSPAPTSTPQPTSAPKPAPPAPAPPQPPPSSGPCGFVLGFAELHRTLSGKDGNCVDNEHDDPNGTGDRVQTTVKGDGTPGYMVWQKFSNSMRWTDGFRTFTYSKCLLQERLNTQTYAWEKNPSLLVQPGDAPPPGACNLS